MQVCLPICSLNPFGDVSKSLPCPNAARRRTARNKLTQNGLGPKIDPKQPENGLGEPKAVPKEPHRVKPAATVALETVWRAPKLAQQEVWASTEMIWRAPKQAKKQSSFWRIPKTFQKWSGEPRHQTGFAQVIPKTVGQNSGQRSGQNFRQNSGAQTLYNFYKPL